MLKVFISSFASIHTSSSVLWKSTVCRSRVCPSPRRHFKPPYSSFRTPTSVWKDHFRSQIHAQQQKRSRGPFVAQRYQEFVRKYPNLGHAVLQDRHFYPFPSPSTTSAIPSFSHLQSRLQLRNNPHASARRNALLRSRQRSKSFEELSRVRLRRRRRRDVFYPPLDALTRHHMVSAYRLTYPKRWHVHAVDRFSRRRLL